MYTYNLLTSSEGGQKQTIPPLHLTLRTMISYIGNIYRNLLIDLLQEVETNHPARLFQMSNASGRFTVDEIPDFTQQDLVSDDVMILDVWDTVYVWIGEGANKQERDEAERLAIVRTFIWTPLYVTMLTHVAV